MYRMIATNLVVRNALIFTLVWICIKIMFCNFIFKSSWTRWFLLLLLTLFLFVFVCIGGLLLFSLFALFFRLLSTIWSFLFIIVFIRIFFKVWLALDAWYFIPIIRLSLCDETSNWILIFRLFFCGLSRAHLGLRNFSMLRLDYYRKIRRKNTYMLILRAVRYSMLEFLVQDLFWEC